MKEPRRIVVLNDVYTVPPRISRIDTHRTHGWQVRYLGTKFFSDGRETPKESLQAAIGELYRRTRKEPVQAVARCLRGQPLAHKQNDLPAGISGPVVIRRDGRAPYAEFKVSIPRKGQAPRATTVHIGSESTWCDQLYKKALVKAVRLREAGIKLFEQTPDPLHAEGRGRTSKRILGSINTAQ